MPAWSYIIAEKLPVVAFETGFVTELILTEVITLIPVVILIITTILVVRKVELVRVQG